jgi:hypothetical protein
MVNRIKAAFLVGAVSITTVGFVAEASTSMQGQRAATTVVIHADQYVVAGQDIDDLAVLEQAVRATSNRRVVLLACGRGTARAQLAAAQRLSDLALELIVSDSDFDGCEVKVTPRPIPISQRIGLRPFGIDDETVNRWLRSVMP